MAFRREERNTTMAMRREMEGKLLNAARAGRTAEVKQLIEKGVDVNTRRDMVCICSRCLIYQVFHSTYLI